MLMTLTLPSINDEMSRVVIEELCAPAGCEVPAGGKLVQVMLTVGVVDPQDCAPVSHYHLLSRDRVWARRWSVAPQDECDVGAVLGLFSTDPDEPLDGTPERELRLTVAGIVPDMFGWEDWK